MKRTEKSAAVVTVRHADKMTRSGRKGVATWLRRQARFVESHRALFSGRFTARYLYRA